MGLITNIETAATGLTLRQWLSLAVDVLVVVAILVVGIWFYNHHKTIESLQSYHAQAAPILDATQGGIAAQNAQLAAAQENATVVATARASKDRAYQEVTRRDQTAATWDAARIPDSVRNADDPSALDRPADSSGRSPRAHH